MKQEHNANGLAAKRPLKDDFDYDKKMSKSKV